MLRSFGFTTGIIQSPFYFFDLGAGALFLFSTLSDGFLVVLSLHENVEMWEQCFYEKHTTGEKEDKHFKLF